MKQKIALLFLLIVLGNGANAQNIDIGLLKRINTGNPLQQPVWTPVTHSPYFIGPAYSAGNIAFGLIRNDKIALKNGTESLMGLAIGAIVSTGVKEVINRPRPAEQYPGEISSYNYAPGRSFPSGHTTIAFATATTLMLQYRKWYVAVPAYAWAASVGYSRMKLGRHYPTDVLGGIIIGIGSGYLSHWLTGKIFSHDKLNDQQP